MFSQINQSRSKSTKRKRHPEKRQKQQRLNCKTSDEHHSSSACCGKLLRTAPRQTVTNQLISLLVKSPLALAAFYILSMSAMFYKVLGATRCPKIKKHAGIKLRPINKAKEPFVPGDMLLYSCESEDFTQTIKCLDDGRWSDHPHCPDPSNNTCPDLGPVPHGAYNASGPPFKVGTVLAFRCENEALPPGMMLPFLNNKQQQQQQLLATTTTQSLAPTTLTTKPDMILQNASQSGSATTAAFPFEQSHTNNSETVPMRYNLTGHRVLKCLPSSKWNHPLPTCMPFHPEPPSNTALLLTTAALILIPLLILIAVSRLVMRWRKRRLQQERWKQYFTDYKYRHSKTNITFGQRPEQPQTATIPVTDL